MSNKTYTLLQVLQNLRGFDTPEGFVVIRRQLFSDVVQRLEEAEDLEAEIEALQETIEKLTHGRSETADEEE